MNELEKYTTEELKSELRRRVAVNQEIKPVCKNCVHRYVGRIQQYSQSYCDCRTWTWRHDGKKYPLMVHSNTKACDKYECKEQ